MLPCKSTHACINRRPSTKSEWVSVLRTPSDFADGVARHDATRWVKGEDFQGGGKGRRNAIRPPFPLLEPPLEVLETFGGAKVSYDDQLKTKLEIQKTMKEILNVTIC